MCPAGSPSPRSVSHLVRPRKNATSSCVDVQGKGIVCLMNIPAAEAYTLQCICFVFERVEFCWTVKCYEESLLRNFKSNRLHRFGISVDCRTKCSFILILRGNHIHILYIPTLLSYQFPLNYGTSACFIHKSCFLHWKSHRINGFVSSPFWKL